MSAKPFIPDCPCFECEEWVGKENLQIIMYQWNDSNVETPEYVCPKCYDAHTSVPGYRFGIIGCTYANDDERNYLEKCRQTRIRSRLEYYAANPEFVAKLKRKWREDDENDNCKVSKHNYDESSDDDFTLYQIDNE